MPKHERLGFPRKKFSVGEARSALFFSARHHSWSVCRLLGLGCQDKGTRVRMGRLLRHVEMLHCALRYRQTSAVISERRRGNIPVARQDRRSASLGISDRQLMLVSESWVGAQVVPRARDFSPGFSTTQLPTNGNVSKFAAGRSFAE